MNYSTKYDSVCEVLLITGTLNMTILLLIFKITEITNNYYICI